MTDKREALIIGGGVIGLASAHYLLEDGFRVTVVDKGTIGSACSLRNCGLVCPSHVLPLAEPGAISSAIKALLSRDGAFRIKPRFSFALWSWLWRFARRCNRRDLLAAGHAIQPLLASSMELYAELAPQLDCEWQKKGLYFVYRDHAAFESYSKTNAIMDENFDEGAEQIETAELLEREPSLSPDVAGAWFYDEDAHLKPERLMSSWRKSLQSSGVRFVENAEFSGFDQRGAAAKARIGSEWMQADVFIVATGAWTPQLSELLGYRVPVEPGKGYSVIVPRTPSCPRAPMVFPEHRVVVTPFEDGMRLGSIMEFAGYDETLSPKRIRQLESGAAHYLRDPIEKSFVDEWYGWRPMTYDSTPVIGPCPGFSNVYLATGHNMLGLSMAPATAKLLSELIRGVEPHVAAQAYSADRF